MASSTSLPRITEAQIKQWSSSQSFDRGDRYYQQGAIFNAVRQGTDIRAECQGSRTYHVQATLEASGADVTNARCSCPYDWGGLCKHLVALLLTYVHNPAAFQVIPPMTELLKSRKREELVSLIEQMVQQYPDLLYLVELSTPQPAGQAIDVSTYRRKVQSALRRDDVEDVLASLQGVEKAAEQLHQRQDWLNAGVVYQMLLAEITNAYDDELQSVDYDGDVVCVAQDAIANLGHSLEHAQNLDSKRRHAWLDTLLNAVLKDIEIGGMDFGYGATEILFDLATDTEWQALESRILAEIERQKDGWGKEQLINLLAQRYKRSGHQENASALIHQLGTPEQRAFLLVEEGKFEDAIAIAQSNFSTMPGLVIRFADALVEANKPNLALQYIAQLEKDAPYRGYQSWLSNFHRSHGNPELALKIDTQQFQAHPSFPGYLQLRTLAQSLNQWDSLRKTLITQLEKTKQWIILIDIALEEGDSDRAFKLLSKAETWVKSSRAAEVAKAIASTRPQDAIALYTHLAESAIAQKSRSAYQTAATYLKKIKKLQSTEEWNAYIHQLRTKYARLPALQDEFKKAKL